MRWVEFAYYWGLLGVLGVLCMAAPRTEPSATGLGAKDATRTEAKALRADMTSGSARAGAARAGKAPGPRGLPYVGTSFMASWDPMGRLGKWATKYGDVVYYHFFDFHVYVLFHPRDVEKVLLGKTEAFSKGMTSLANPELFGNGLLTSDGEFWRRQRRLSNPAFHRESILRYAEITTEEAARLLDRWKSGETRNIHNDMMHVTLRTVLRSLFGGELGEGMGAIEPALEAIMRASTGFYSIAGYLGVPSRTRTR